MEFAWVNSLNGRTILTLIPARGGSKGIPRKNVLPMAGKPMIAWTIDAAKEIGLDPIWLSTDDEEIASVCHDRGLDVPFMRPDELASDTATALGVALHALDFYQAKFGQDPDYLLFLQPTSPLRLAEDIDQGLHLGLSHDAKAVIGVVETHHPYLSRTISSEGILEPVIDSEGRSLRRQDLPDTYVINGAFYLVKSTTLRGEKTFFPDGALGFPMPPQRSIDIDDPWQFELVDLLLQSRKRA